MIINIRIIHQEAEIYVMDPPKLVAPDGDGANNPPSVVIQNGYALPVVPALDTYEPYQFRIAGGNPVNSVTFD